MPVDIFAHIGFVVILLADSDKHRAVTLFGLHLSFIGWYLIVFVIVGVYEGVILALMPDSFLGIVLGSLILTVLTGVVDIYLTPYFALSECGFYLRATAPEEPPRQDRSSYTPEF